jgi:hypothetical protein
VTVWIGVGVGVWEGVGVAVSTTTRVWVRVGVNVSAGVGVKVLVGMGVQVAADVGMGEAVTSGCSATPGTPEDVKRPRIMVTATPNTMHTKTPKIARMSTWVRVIGLPC